MNVTAHQEKNDETKMGKRRAEEEKKQATNFKEAGCCLSAIIHGEAQQKNEGVAWGKWDPQEGQWPF